MNNIKIGRYVKFALESLDYPVFPIGQDGSNDGDSYLPPFITYRRKTFSEDSDKDHTYESPVSVSISVIAKNYDQLIDILSSVSDALHTAPLLWNAMPDRPFNISDQSLTYSEEQMDESFTLYVCEIIATIETTNI